MCERCWTVGGGACSLVEHLCSAGWHLTFCCQFALTLSLIKSKIQLQRGMPRPSVESGPAVSSCIEVLLYPSWMEPNAGWQQRSRHESGCSDMPTEADSVRWGGDNVSDWYLVVACCIFDLHGLSVLQSVCLNSVLCPCVCDPVLSPLERSYKARFFLLFYILNCLNPCFFSSLCCTVKCDGTWPTPTRSAA